jgi:protein-S-isoprenylcysteine O-methyltransferase Ste14
MTRWLSPPVAFALAAIATWWIGSTVAVGRYSFAYQAAVAVAVVVVGVAIVAVSLRSFAAVGTTPNPTQPRNATTLVTSGVYAMSRNPMYVGDAIILAGLAIWFGSVPGLLPIAAFVWYIDRFQIAAEEKALVGLFGDRYIAYRSKVRRWF